MIQDKGISLVDDKGLWKTRSHRAPRQYGLYASDRKEKMGIEKRDSIYHRPIRKVKKFNHLSLFDRGPYKSKHRFLKL